MSINVKDVINIKVPYPSFDSGLVKKQHMYICIKKKNDTKHFVKVQTKKPYMLKDNSPIINYIDEYPDISRNPFTKVSRIDLDKIFYSTDIMYLPELLARRRKDICFDLYNKIINKLKQKSYKTIKLHAKDMSKLNHGLIVHIYNPKK